MQATAEFDMLKKNLKQNGVDKGQQQKKIDSKPLSFIYVRNLKNVVEQKMEEERQVEKKIWLSPLSRITNRTCHALVKPLVAQN